MAEIQSWAESGDMSEILQGRPNFPGEIHVENDVEVWNNLRVAAEVKLGEGRWQVIYPSAPSLRLAMDSADVDLQVSVRLRDDFSVWGMCAAVPNSSLVLSSSFGDFGARVTKHIQEEEAAASRESRLRMQRQAEIDQKLHAEVTRTILRRQKWLMISIFLWLLILMAAMVCCAAVSFSLETQLQGVDLALALLGLFVCAGCGFSGFSAAAGGFARQVRGSVQAVRPELRRYEDEGLVAQDDGDWRALMTGSCACSVPWVFIGCMVAMSVANSNNGYGSLLAVLWGPVALMMCWGGVCGWREAREAGGGCREKVVSAMSYALILPFFWPFAIVFRCGLESRFASLLMKPPTRSLDAAVHTIHEHTIVFEGNVLAQRETVCSWPGKYATAWDELVAGSRQDDISAAVVFLPEGPDHYGFHDPIPTKQDLQDLHGECWCTALYGECKPWGCRWWSKWIANIEQAVSQECTLVVYYFNGMKGKGKAEDFTRAGKEHLRREAICRRKDVFFQSEGFQDALKAGLQHLSKEKGPDSSSPYSREVHRLFLATLQEADRQFLEASEGLGNSQKAEVAWLERNAYPYIEKEVWELESSSPEAIGQASE